MTKKVQFNDFQTFGFYNGLNDADSNKFNVDGYAIHTGMFHGYIEIPETEIENATNSLRGRRLFKNHNYDLDDIIGKVTNTETAVDPTNGKIAVKYSGYIDKMYDSIIYKIENDLIDATSIGFQFEPYCSICGKHLFESDCMHWFGDNGFHVVAKNVDVYELSVVSIPADDDATVSAMAFSENQFNKQFKQQFKEKFDTHNRDIDALTEKEIKSITKPPMFNIRNKTVKTGGIKVVDSINNKKTSDKMAEENQKIIELQDEILELKDAKTDLEKDIETLKTEFAEEKQALESKFEDKVLEQEEAKLTVIAEKEALETELAEKTEVLEAFEEQFAEIENEKLTGIREEVLALHKELTGEEELEGIEEMSEETLRKRHEMYTKIQSKQSKNKPTKFNKTEQKYSKNIDTEKLRKEGKHEELLGGKVKNIFEL